MRFKLCLLLVSLVFLSCRSSTLEPVGGSTNFQYGVPQESHVKIVIVNNYNTVVAKLVNKVQAAGVYQVNFSHSDYDLLEGVYFVKFYLDSKIISSRTLIAVNP